jgi:acyl-CoA synthetase (AMP-forming)/AMP-acid ligase II
MGSPTPLSPYDRDIDRNADFHSGDCPRTIVFEPIPKTSTGKVQKFALRERAKRMAEMQA